MSTTPTKQQIQSDQYKTPKKNDLPKKRTRTPSLKAVENIQSGTESDTTQATSKPEPTSVRRSARKPSPNKKYIDSDIGQKQRQRQKRVVDVTDEEDEEDLSDLDDLEELTGLAVVAKPTQSDIQLLQEESDVAGRNVFGFNTPKKRDGMALAAMNTPKTPKTPKTPRAAKTPDTKRRKSTAKDPKTPSRVRHNVKSQIAKLARNESDTDFSADGSDYEPSEDSDSSSSSSAEHDDSADADADADEPKTPCKGRRPIIVPVLPKTPSAARQRQSARVKKSMDYIPESDGYFQSHSSSKVVTSDHTLDRLKNPRLPADQLFTLLSEMKLSKEHEASMNAMMEEYRSYFPKWMLILNEGYNILVYGLGSKRELLQSFHRESLAKHNVLVINGFFPSLTLKEILDNICDEILEVGPSPANAHEAVDVIEEEFAQCPEVHLFLIVHNLDGAMLRNAKAQAIMARLAKVPNIHLIASIDHINTPLLWDQAKLSNFNFSWWDCTTMLPYSAETAYENSLLVQNSGELALSSMRSVFLSLTTNSRGIYMLIVKHQLKNKTNPNYQGMAFKDLYWSCREAFLVSSDLALRAQLTEFLDHKLVKSKRSVDGSEQLTIPIEAGLLQQFLDEQEKK